MLLIFLNNRALLGFMRIKWGILLKLITQMMGYTKSEIDLLRIILKLKRQNNLIQGNKLNLNDKLEFTYN